MSTSYNVHTDVAIQALIAEAQADPDVIGLVLIGSRALDAVTPESDYDAIFVVTDEALARYEQTQRTPARGTTITPPINTKDIWNDSPGNLQIEKVELWTLPTFAEALVLYDRTGETTLLIQALSQMPADRAQTAATNWYGTYLNGMFRSLKCWRWGNELGGRMEAAQTADYLLHLLFALERQWRPYSSRLIFHLDQLAPQGWQSGELRAILLDLVSTGDPSRQQVVGRRVTALLRGRGFGHIEDEWAGRIAQALAWVFPSTT
jgi:Domain of unknown function (DUF4037)